MTVKRIFGGLQCLETRNKNFDEGKKYPIIIMLNGAGSRGDDLEIVRDNALLDYQIAHEKFPFIVFSPLCQENTWFDIYEHLKKCILEIIDLPYVDKKRVYLSGISMGGYAAWQILQSLPTRFAAAIICCGGGMYWNAGRIQTPVWVFHGEKDKTVLVEESQKMIKVLKDYGIETRETYYPNIAHNCWTNAFVNDAVYEWLLEHINNRKD